MSRLTDWAGHDINSVDWAVKPQLNQSIYQPKIESCTCYGNSLTIIHWLLRIIIQNVHAIKLNQIRAVPEKKIWGSLMAL